MTLKQKALRFCLPRVAVAAAGIALLTGAAMVEDDSIYASWFRYGVETTQGWQFSAVDGNALMVSVEPKGRTKAKKHVFVLYPKPSSAYDVCMTKILTIFEEKGIDADFTIVNFESDDAKGRNALRIASTGGYDLIFSMGSVSTAWLFDAYLGGEVPVVSVCSKDPVQLGQAESYDRGSGSNFAFTSLNMPIEVQMAYVLDLKPELKNLAVLVDSKNVSAVQTQAQPIATFARQRGIRVIEVSINDPKKAAQELSRLVPQAVAAMRKNDPDLANSLFWITGSTSVFREIATINAHSDRVPVLSVVPEVVTAGDDSAVMSIGISFESNAHLAALFAVDVLSGRRRAGDMEVGIVSPPDIAINFRKAREIGLEIPFSFFEGASFVYDYDGRAARNSRSSVRPN